MDLKLLASAVVLSLLILFVKTQPSVASPRKIGYTILYGSLRSMKPIAAAAGYTGWLQPAR